MGVQHPKKRPAINVAVIEADGVSGASACPFRAFKVVMKTPAAAGLALAVLRGPVEARAPIVAGVEAALVKRAPPTKSRLATHPPPALAAAARRIVAVVARAAREDPKGPRRPVSLHPRAGPPPPGRARAAAARRIHRATPLTPPNAPPISAARVGPPRAPSTAYTAVARPDVTARSGGPTHPRGSVPKLRPRIGVQPLVGTAKTNGTATDARPPPPKAPGVGLPPREASPRPFRLGLKLTKSSRPAEITRAELTGSAARTASPALALKRPYA